MKTVFIILVTILVINPCIKSQDVIYRNNGEYLYCKITKIDSTNIYFTMTINKKPVSTLISRNDTKGYAYNIASAYRDEPKSQKNSTAIKKESKLNVSQNHYFLLSFDPLGFITMGPAVCGEILFQGNSRVGFGFYTGFRLTNLGIMSNGLLSGGSMDFGSYTVPLAFRIYPKPRYKSDGFFVGPHVEFGKTTFTDDDKNKTRAFGAELGYKWVFKGGFTLELMDAIGLIQTKDIPRDDYWYGYYDVDPQWETLAFVPYMLSVKIGVSF